jgi:hypothetical protein
MRAGGVTGQNKLEQTMKKVIENTGNSPMYEMGKMIPPGEIAVVDVPDEAPTAQPDPEPDPDAALQELLALSVDKVKASLDGVGADTLKRLRELEAAGKARKGVLEAIDAAAIAAADKALNLKSDPL